LSTLDHHAAPSAHLVLVGLPGAGKSTHGRRAAKLLGWPFVDLDRQIVKSTGHSVAELFEFEGEAGFRARERQATQELVRARQSVIAPGGGWMMDPENVALLRPPSIVIWLRVTPESAVRRMGERIRVRPMLRSENPTAVLAALLEKRQATYASADATIDTEALDWQQVARSIAEFAQRPDLG
jgi:shikimate kinase